MASFRQLVCVPKAASTATKKRRFAFLAQIGLFSWGLNSAGGLGLGNTTYYSSPKQVGALTDWVKIAGGAYHTVSLK